MANSAIPLAYKLLTLINEIFQKGYIPAPFCYSRLHLLNKLKDGSVPGINDLRPIMISSPIIKVIESVALADLKDTLEKKISRAQVGFLPELGTQIHILRLIGRAKDIQNSYFFAPRKWRILFVDFKAAFDSVDQEKLFERLEGSGISSRTTNILRMLYNSYQFTIQGCSPMRIKLGVAQGSLVSPILYDWYVDSLVRALVAEFGEDNVFAYADDIAVLCLGIASVRKALDVVRNWSTSSGATVNHKK